ncbi:serine/threonine protein kinase [bacterium]|nr:serine/threonine protein kinase [bacterium]
MASLKRLGPYLFERELGHGALGTVYLGTQSDGSPPVAIKVLSPEVFPEQDLAKLFQREAQPAYALRHRNIIEVLEQGYDEGKHYVVMEYLPAGDLQCPMSAGNYPDWRDSVRLMISVLNALQYAHDNLVLHCDVKPANILLDNDGQPILTGFGMFYITDEEIEREAEFMAPELVTRGDIDGRVDTYAAALVLYELLTKIHPFRGEGRTAVTRPDNINSEIPVELSDLILRGMARSRDDRPGAGQLARQLGEFMTTLVHEEEPEPEQALIEELALPDVIAFEPPPEPVSVVLCSPPPEQEAKNALELHFANGGAKGVEWIPAGAVVVFAWPLAALEYAKLAVEQFSLDHISACVVTGIFKRDEIWAETRPDLGELACRNLDKLHTMLKATPRGKVRMDTATARHAPESIPLIPIDGDVMEIHEAQAEPEPPPPTPPPSLEDRLGPGARKPRPSFVEPVPAALRGQSRTIEVPKKQKEPINWNNVISFFLIVGFTAAGYYLYEYTRPGTLILTCIPANKCSLSIDSTTSKPYKNGTPISLSRGEHTVKVSAKGFATYQGKVTITSRATNKVPITLKKPGKPKPK